MTDRNKNIINFLIKHKIGFTELFGTECAKMGMPLLAKYRDEYHIGDVIYISKDLNEHFKWRSATIHIFNTNYRNAGITLSPNVSEERIYKLNIFLVFFIKLFKVKCS